MDEEKKDLIKRFAYVIYQNRFRRNLDGDEFSDWLQAEEEYEKLEKLHYANTKKAI